MDVLVGLDAGTTATKAVTAGTDAVVRDTASVGYPLLVPQPGWAELDPRTVTDAAVAALVEVAGLARERGDTVVGVCLSAAMHGLAPMAEDGTPLGPLSTWADGRATPQADALRADGRAAGLHARTGTPVHPMSPLVKLAWWSQSDPDLLASTPLWGGVKELLVSAVCGQARVVDLSCASATGTYHLEGRHWDAEALEIAGVREDQLAEVVPTTHVLRGLRPRWRAPPGCRATCPWSSAPRTACSPTWASAPSAPTWPPSRSAPAVRCAWSSPARPSTPPAGCSATPSPTTAGCSAGA
jgi:gluconokinase